MCFVRLEASLHHGTLSQQIGKSLHGIRVQHVYFEVVLVANVEAIEGDAFDERDARNEAGFRGTFVHISSKGETESMIYGEVKARYEGCGYRPISRVLRSFILSAPTCILINRAIIFNIEIWKCAMNMGAHFLSCLCAPKHSQNRHLWLLAQLRRPHIAAQLGIELRWRTLVMVDAIQSDSESIHDRFMFSNPIAGQEAKRIQEDW